MNNATKQFNEIFSDHNDPEKRAIKKLIKRREERVNNKKRDLGL